MGLGGRVLATQSVWEGVLALGLPTPKASEEATKRGYRFKLNKHIYRSDLETTKI